MFHQVAVAAYARNILRNWVHFNDSQWPLVVFETPVRFTNVQLARFFGDLELCLKKSEPFALVFDLTASALPEPEVRTALTAFYERHWATTTERIVAEAIVVSSRPMRAWVDTISTCVPPGHARALLPNRPDALRWARQMLSAAGCPPPEHHVRKSGFRFEANASALPWQRALINR